MQIRRFAKANNRNIILFLEEHCRTKKNGGQIVNNTNLLTVQDDVESIGPGILYYYKEMPTCLLTNSSTQLGKVNGTQTLVFGIICDPQGGFSYFDTFNFAYYCLKFLHVAGQQYIVELTSSYMHFVALFLNLLCNVYLVFPVKLSAMAKEATFNRKQIRITLRFAYTKYKVQRAMFKSVTLDL